MEDREAGRTSKGLGGPATMEEVMRILRIRAILGIDTLMITQVLMRSQAMYNGLNGDKTTYANPTIPLNTFEQQIQDVSAADQAVKQRTIGARATRDVHRGVLLGSMVSEMSFVQAIADTTPGRAVQIIENAGLVVAKSTVRPAKGLLTLKNGAASGSVECEVNVGLLIGAGALHPHEHRFFNWSFTTDGKTFTNALSTTRPRTLLTGFAPLTLLGVRVSLTTSAGPGEWSPIVSITVH